MTHYRLQHPQVVALVERARRLTGGEARRLAAAVDASWAAGDAAWDAAEAAGHAEAAEAAENAAWAATWAATGDAAWDAARAARDAALALATRHLIGQGSYTTEHYAILTRPWRRVIGPVHPDDPALAEPTHGETP